MAGKSTYSGRIRITLFCVLLVTIFSCSSRSDYAGLYKTPETGSKEPSELELNENGEGLWRVGEGEESFSWYVKRGTIRLNTKGGGVVVAEIKDDTLKIALPGGRKFTFKKVN